MNGNVTKEGIASDFQWMKRVGIGGVQNFDADLNTQQLVTEPVSYRTPQWRETFRYAVELANQMGLEFAIAGAPGWSETGGPWVKPEQAMKKLVWSETRLDGGVRFKGKLPQPPTTTGPFQDIPLAKEEHRYSEPPQYYADTAVIAYRRPDSDATLADLPLQVTSSQGAIDAARLMDGDLAHTVHLAVGKDGTSWIQYSYNHPKRVQALTAVISRPTGSKGLRPSATLESTTDGRTFQKIADLPRDGAAEQTIAFAPVTARVFRVLFNQADDRAAANPSGTQLPREYEVAELVLHGAARVHRFEDKSGWEGLTLDPAAGFFYARPITAADSSPPAAAEDVIAKADVVDITDKMQPDGTLEWTPPTGHWVVLRLGYSLTGKTNHPASPQATGLEVDKLNRNYVKAYVDAYLSEYEQALGPGLIGAKGLEYMVTDSWEAGAQNWTDDMLSEFNTRRGYDMRPWLPVLTGRVIESAQESDRFLWDFRRTLADLVAEEHYGQISDMLHARGMGRYGEAHENGRKFVGDGMEVKKTADVPMGAKWAPPLKEDFQTVSTQDTDLRESASVAHIYGQNLVAAESLTAYGNPYGYAPETLKPTADRMLAMGVNRFVIHTSVHQPLSGPGPGVGLGPFGQWFTRHETWAEQARPWVTYLARSSYLLQQGRFFADVAFFYGEDTNITQMYRWNLPEIPHGYDYDFVNADVIMNKLMVRNRELTTPSGMRYRVLAFDPRVQRISLPVLRKIRDFVNDGAIVVGTKPVGTPSLADDESEFRAIVDALWGEGTGVRTLESGHVFADRSLGEVLSRVGIPPDFSYSGSNKDATLSYLHRVLEHGDLYFISNPDSETHGIQASFRVTGDAPELWRADTGAIEALSYRMERGRTIVPLRLEPHEAIFVLFRRRATVQSLTLPQATSEVLTVVEAPWDVSFPANLGAPAHTRFERLQSWTDSQEPGIKYFSGTATYSKTVRFRCDCVGSRVQLDLGQVKNLAEVIVNGHSMGVLWKSPFTADITAAVKAGDNRIDIKVTNLWPNRLIGDKQPGARKIASATFDPFKADSPLLQSGLLGPVTLLKSSVQRQPF